MVSLQLHYADSFFLNIVLSVLRWSKMCHRVMQHMYLFEDVYKKCVLTWHVCSFDSMQNVFMIYISLFSYKITLKTLF